MAQALRFGIVHDFRCPPGSDVTMPQVYAETFEQVVLAEQLGLEQCWFTEHHFIEDGYLPNFVPVAGAAAALTTTMRFSTDICLMPFRDPVRLAEDLAVLDNISGGRMELGIGMGYAAHEFAGFGLPVSRRVSLTEEAIDVLRLAWSGEPFSYEGKRYSYRTCGSRPTRCSPAVPRCGWRRPAKRVRYEPLALTPTCCPRGRRLPCSTHGRKRWWLTAATLATSGWGSSAACT